MKPLMELKPPKSFLGGMTNKEILRRQKFHHLPKRLRWRMIISNFTEAQLNEIRKYEAARGHG